MRWSVVLRADGDRVLTREEVVELADAIAAYEGIASGIGTTAYAAQLVVDADGRSAAEQQATAAFTQAVTVAQLPPWPVTTVELVGEDDEPDYLL